MSAMKSSKYILTFDAGTSGTKAALYDVSGSLVASYVSSYGTAYPAPNCVEQKPADWWDAVCTSTRELLKESAVTPGEIACIGLCGQMMGCVLVDDKGEVLRDAIIWADSRATKQEELLRGQIDPGHFYQITGHRPAAFYSLSKLLWVHDNEPEIFAKTHKMLQTKDYIAYRLTGRFVTDYSDACGTNLFDIRKKVWSQEILDAVSLSGGLLPEPCVSTEIIGNVTPDAARETGLLDGTPVVIGGGDGACAATGAGAVREGLAYVVIGSSSWISCLTREPVCPPEMKTFNWVALDPAYYTPCGTMQAAGYSVSWLRDTLCDIEGEEAAKQNISIYEIIDEKIKQSPPGANNLIYLPYLLGERSPRWNADAKGAFVGLTMTSTKNDIMRAVLEGVGFNLKVIFDIISRDNPAASITAIGGGAENEVWLQILADIWQTPIEVPQHLEEATSIGAAVCAGVATGAFDSFDRVSSFNRTVKTIHPNPANAEIYGKLFRLFDKLYYALEDSFKEF